jgi:hypothetical protein
MTNALLRWSLLAAAMAACGKAKWIPPGRQCPGELRPVWMANPNYSMCVVTSFRTHDLRTWVRARPGSPSDTLTVQADVSKMQMDLTGGWPPRLVPLEGQSRGNSDSIRTDTIAGALSYTETRRESGKVARNIPIISFVSGIKTSDGRYLVASGETASRATLDTLLLMFRSVSRAQSPDPNRR